jgi:aromatic ring-opening dioxygenase catalytic subunit (LigB family)
MAEIAGIFAVSHTPVMTNLPDAADPAVRDAVFDRFRAIGEAIAACDPQALIVISNDHLHNFFLDNFPAFCIGAAEQYESPVEGWLKVEKRIVPGDTALGAYLVEAMLESGFDPAFSMSLTLDHAMVTPLELGGFAGLYPVVPLLVNCVQPPLPRMRRCIDLGKALAAAIARYDGADRVAVVATGGLSHDVGTPRMGFVNEGFDREFLRLLADGEPEALACFGQAEVNSAGNGAEEIRNWLVAHGIAGCRGFALHHYHPVNAWYTGIALGHWEPGA